MLPLTFVITRALALMAADATPRAVAWLAAFGTRCMARRLGVPEIVVHGICLYLAAYASEVERNASLVCPVRVFHDLRRNRPAHLARSSSRDGTSTERSA
jgi:hypothetical protein